ncbi:MAG: YfhO family protein [Anaerolineales bacterium]
MGRPTIADLRRNLLPWLPLVGGPALTFGPALIQGRALFWGAPLLQFTPWRTAAKQMLLSGHFPLWNPWLGLGAPLLANYQSALLYPPNWILMFLDVAWGQTLLVMLHLIWAGAGMAVLIRRLGFGRFAQTMAGLCFGMSGYLVARSGFLSINAAAAWLPWVIVAAERALNGRRLAGIALLGLALGMQWLAGHAQTAAYTWVFCAAWMGYRGWMQACGSGLSKAIIGLGLSSALAFGLAAVQLIPTLEYLGQSDRSAGLDPEFALNYSFWPWRLLGLVAPDLFGNPRSGNFWGYGNYWEDHLYLGSLPILLAVGALISRGGDRMKRFLLAAGGVAFVLALGKNTPLFPWLFRSVPAFALFQAPTRWNLLLVFSLAMLAGIGADAWQAASGRRLYWLRLGAAGAAAAVVAGALGGRLLPGIEPSFSPAILLGSVGLLITAILALTRRNPQSPAWTTAALGFVMLDLVFAARGLNPTLPLASINTPSSLRERIGAEHRVYMEDTLEQFVKFELAFRFDTFQPEIEWSEVREVGLPNTTILDGLRSVNNFDPILPARYLAWRQRLDAAAAPIRTALLKQADVGWQAVRTGISFDYAPVVGPARAWVVPQSEWVSSSTAALLKTSASGFDPRQTVVLEGAMPAADGGGSGQILALNEVGPNRVELSVSAPQGGWLVLADSWFPGWAARIDAEPAEIFAANGLLRAVWLAPGDHSVLFSYLPSSVVVGLAISALAWPVAFGLLRRR